MSVRGRHRAEVVEDVAAGDLLGFDLVDDVRQGVLDAVERAAPDDFIDFVPDVAFKYTDDADDRLVLSSSLLRALYEALCGA